ncbi:MAG: hypothetical protein ACRDTU_07060 [Micromonosporaceae bacterium]
MSTLDNAASAVQTAIDATGGVRTGLDAAISELDDVISRLVAVGYDSGAQEAESAKSAVEGLIAQLDALRSNADDVRGQITAIG